MTASQTAAGPRRKSDHGSDRAGEVFAKALLGAAGNDAAAAVAELGEIVEQLIDKQPRFEEVLSSRMIAADEQVALVGRIFEGRVSPVLVNFLKVLIEHGRGGALRNVLESARAILNEQQGRVPVRVTTAAALDDATLNKIVETLRRAIGGEPVLTPEVDPRLIGGAVYRIGDKVFDGSVATQLERMRTQLLNRSVHEIQSGRDRFGHSEGN